MSACCWYRCSLLIEKFILFKCICHQCLVRDVRALGFPLLLFFFSCTIFSTMKHSDLRKFWFNNISMVHLNILLPPTIRSNWFVIIIENDLNRKCKWGWSMNLKLLWLSIAPNVMNALLIFDCCFSHHFSRQIFNLNENDVRK